MKDLILDNLHNEVITNPEWELLHKIIFSQDYWKGNITKTAFLTFKELSIGLIIYYHEDFGFYLRFDDYKLDETWVSIGNSNRLTENINHGGPSDGAIAKGLFVSPADAWLAVEEFCKTGNRTDKITWANAKTLPGEAAW